MSKKRESYIEKKCEFNINVGNYESLRVGTVFGEHIEWGSSDERQKKLDALTASLANEVAKSAKEILEAYGLKRHVSDTLKKNVKTGADSVDLDDVTEDSDVELEDFDKNKDDEDFEI